MSKFRVGNWVIADDPTTPRGSEAKLVLETFVRETDALYDLYVDGEVISTTGEHPFWVPDQGWVEAKDLVVGSLLQTEDGRVVDVDRVEKREGAIGDSTTIKKRLFAKLICSHWSGSANPTN